MKNCKTCKQVKPLEDFSSHRSTKDGLHINCRVCVREYNKIYRKANKTQIQLNDKRYYDQHQQKMKARTKQWIEDNREHKREADSAYYEKHKEVLNASRSAKYHSDEKVKARISEKGKEWRQNNRGAVLDHIARRRAAKLNATVKWAEWDQIRDLYNECVKISNETKILHQVDHILPLISDVVCGLHCIDNLRIIPATENNRKKNKIIQV